MKKSLAILSDCGSGAVQANVRRKLSEEVVIPPSEKLIVPPLVAG